MDGLKLMGDVDYSDPDIQKANQEALRKYIRKFYEAQAMTQTLNTNPNWLEEATTSKPYGTVYVYRTDNDAVDNKNERPLTYISYEEMVKKQGGILTTSGTTGSSLDNFLFIGDSRYSTISYQISALGNNIKNAGVGSARIDEWVNVAQNGGTGTVQGKSVDITGNYSGISVQLGANSVYNRVDTAVTEMKTFLEKLKEIHPNTTIYVNSCMQVNTKASSGYSWSPEKMRDYIEEFNNRIEEYCNQTSNLQYIDISENLEDSEGYIKSAYTGDGLHCNGEGGKVFTSNIQKAITGGTGTPTQTITQTNNKPAADITKYFSIDENGKLVIPEVTHTIIKKNGSIISDTTYVYLQRIDYKSAVSQYTTSMNFFLYLTMISQNPEFVSAVADLVKQSEIRLTIMDNTTTTVSKETLTYVEHTKIRKKEKTVTYDSWDTMKQYPHISYTYKETEGTPQTKTEVTEITTTNTTPTAAITYAETWFCEQSVTYNKKKEGPTTTSGEPTKSGEDEEEPEITGEGSATWITDRTVQVDTTTTKETYEEGTRGNVIDKTGEKGSQGLNSSGKVDKNSTFLGLLDDKFKIPNTTRYDSAGGNVVSGAEMLFYLLQKDSSTQNMEMWMRYILNKYTGTNRYGDIKFEDIASNFEIRMLTTGSNFIVNTAISAPQLVITDASILKDAVGKIYTGEMKENLTSEAQNFIDMQTEYHVNAVFAMAVTVVESGAGTGWSAIDRSTYNWYSITGSYKGKTYRNPNSSNPRTWRVYSSFREATFDFGDLIANSSYYFKAGKYTVEEIAPTYCDENWGKSVISIMNEIYATAGIELPTQGFSVGGITTDEEARQLQNYIETELIHTKVHYNYEYQNGPFATWWTSGYNNLSKFQCTWWANGRASMYLEQYGTKYKKYPTQMGNGGDYYDVNKRNGWFNYGSTPKPNSIISWRKAGDYGHVAYVEGVSSDGIYISHAGSGKSWRGIEKIPLDGNVGWSGYVLNGYIYLDEPR